MAEPAVADPERYKDRPFLRLIDCYILDVIGHLDYGQRQALEQMTSRFQKTFSSDRSTWQEIVEEQFDLLPQARDSISTYWKGFEAHQIAHRQDPGPIAFVLSFVEQNFPAHVHESH